MSKSSRSRRSTPARGPRRPVSLAERILRLRQLEEGLAEIYETERAHIDYRMQSFAWRVRVTVPVYEQTFLVRIDLEEQRPVRVIAENWRGAMRHSFGANELCMWFPRDPVDKRWQREQGLLKLVDTAVTHLFKEMFFRETGDWLGEEAPHATPKINAQAGLGRAA